MSVSEEEIERQRLFVRDVVERLIIKGVHPARAEMAVEKGVRFLTMNTGSVVARVGVDYGALDTWQEAAADVLLRELKYYSPEEPKPSLSPTQQQQAKREESAEAALSEKRRTVSESF